MDTKIAKQLKYIASQLALIECNDELCRIASQLAEVQCEDELQGIASQLEEIEKDQNKQGGVGQFFQKKLNLSPNDSRKMVNVVKSLQKPAAKVAPAK